MPGRSLENDCGRTALLAGTIKGHAGAGLCLWLDDGMADDSCKDQRCSVEGYVAVLDLSDHRWECGAVLRDRGEGNAGGCCWPRHPHAMMRAVSSAAGRQIRVGADREGKQRRDQRKAEEKKQNEAENASHSAIVATFVSRYVREMFLCVGNLRPVPAWIWPAPGRVIYLDAGLEAAPWTIRSLSTLKVPGVELACMPAIVLSPSLLTTP